MLLAAAEELMKSDAVRKIGFTGSTRVGKMLMSQAAATVKKVSFLLPACLLLPGAGTMYGPALHRSVTTAKFA